MTAIWSASGTNAAGNDFAFGSTPWTIASATLGVGDIYLVLFEESAVTFSIPLPTLTIDGVSATQVGSSILSSADRMTVWKATVTHTSGNIVVTPTSNGLTVAATWGLIIGNGSPVITSAVTSGSTTQGPVTGTILANGVGVCVIGGTFGNACNPSTWAGATRVAAMEGGTAAANQSGVSGATVTSAGAASVTVTNAAWNFSNNIMVMLAFPDAGGATLVTGWQNNANDIAPRRALAFSAPPAFGRAIPAPANTNAGIPWFEPPDERSILYAKPQKIGAAPTFLLPIPVITWAFSVSDTIFLRDPPIDVAPGFGRAITAPVTVSGISWFEPPDRDCPAIKIRFEAPPALALTPATLPVPIRGMAWFEVQDRQFPARIQSVESPPSAFGRALPANVGISGIGWFEPPDVIRFGRQIGFDAPPTLPAPVVTITWSFVVPDVFSPRRVPMDAPPAFGRSVPAVGVSGIAWFAASDRDPPQVKVRVETAPSIVFSPAALPSIGMAWFEQPDRVPLATVWRLDAPPAFGRSVTTAGVTVSGMAWFAPPDCDPPAYRARIEQPASIALTPATLPVRVSGMAWFVSLDRDRPPLKMFGDTSMAMGFLGISFGPPSFTITRHLSTYGVDLDITMLPDGTPQPYIPSTDGTPWPPA